MQTVQLTEEQEYKLLRDSIYVLAIMAGKTEKEIDELCNIAVNIGRYYKQIELPATNI